jgi:Ca-activated chloride channel homolog
MGAVHAQAPVPPLPAPPSDQSQVFRSGTSVVALNVTVTDGGKFVTGLRLQDFEVYEDGVPQQVRFFESRGVPMDVILLLDTSSSMRDRMPVVHEAAKGFMKVLRPGDRGAVVAFSQNVRVLQPLTSDPEAIEAAINSTTAQGETALHTAIYVALKEFGQTARSASAVRRQAIAVLSDGVDTASLVSFDDVVGLARRIGVNVYTIGLRTSAAQGSAPAPLTADSDYGLKTLAKETGAAAFFPASIRDLNGVYKSIADELESQYSIAYSPTDNRTDGRFRRILVRVTSNPAFRSRARPGYTAGTTRATAEMPSVPR